MGVLCACTGELFLFLSVTLAALEHECAHALAARHYGFTLDKVVLMPYGAVLSGDMGGAGKREMTMICLAGPLASGATALAFTALWWLFPETYPYTDTAAIVSFSLFAVNLLPAYPLDGGRILRALLPRKRGSDVFCKVLTLCISAGILGYFIWSCCSKPSFSALFFAVMLAVGAFGKYGYRPIRFSRGSAFRRGVRETRIALSCERDVRYALRFLREESYLTLLLFDGEEFLGEVTEEELLRAIGRQEYALPLRKLLSDA